MSDPKKPIDNIKEDISFIKVKVENIENNIKEIKDLINDMKYNTLSIIESIELKEVEERRINEENLKKIKDNTWW
tara:strand:+ start:98 stop:322 length:225 start_codon:yes stop_codon:yes gene_type:complete